MFLIGHDVYDRHCGRVRPEPGQIMNELLNSSDSTEIYYADTWRSKFETWIAL